VLSWWTSTALENSRLFNQVAEQREHVENLLQEVSHAQENERKRVAIEIHDGVAQWMVGASYGIKACSALITQSRLSELEIELGKIGQTLQKSVRELRRTIANLRPLALEEGGLMVAIRRAIQPLMDEGLNCRLRVARQLPPLSFPQETTIYWILQETLTNIRNHSKASKVDISIEASDNRITVVVVDNGIGFNSVEILKTAIPLEHMGLLGMKERARLLSGTLDIESESVKGTTVSFEFPVISYGVVNATI
jgi:two-component system sensor histidine kinase DegS